jgi:hypothetical protein
MKLSHSLLTFATFNNAPNKVIKSASEPNVLQDEGAQLHFIAVDTLEQVGKRGEMIGAHDALSCQCRRERYWSLSHRRLGVTPQAIGRYFDQRLDPSVTTVSVGSGS